MAFNWQTFRIRTISSVIFVAVMILGLWNRWTFLLLFSTIHFGCWWEYLKLTEKIHKTVFHPYIKLGLMVTGYGLMLWFCGPLYEIKGYELKQNLSLPVSAAGFAILLIGIFQKTPIKIKLFGIGALALLYISLCCGFMIDFYSMTGFHIYDTMYVLAPDAIPIAILASIWLNDTLAYLVGSIIGRTQLSKISPKKTWEGTIGGIILGTAAASFLLPLIFRLHDTNFLIFLAIIAAVVSITGTFGDLLESKLKRMADVKDTGNLIPGHGGFLDRFDSMLLAIPCVWLLLHFFAR
jgi:phosphatidate cytidylyltransferase